MSATKALILIRKETKVNFHFQEFVHTYMYCPKCGKAEQLTETYCRQCGVFLPDLSKALKPEVPAEMHLKSNCFLSIMTIVTSFTLAGLLYAILGFKPDTHALIYITAGLLLAIGSWHIQTLIRTRMLRAQIERMIASRAGKAGMRESPSAFESRSTAKLLDPANFRDTVPASVTENTTKHLVEKSVKSR